MTHRSLTCVVCASTVSYVVDPCPILHHKLVSLAGEVIKASRPASLTTVEPTDDPPFPFNLIIKNKVTILDQLYVAETPTYFQLSMPNIVVVGFVLILLFHW